MGSVSCPCKDKVVTSRASLTVISFPEVRNRKETESGLGCHDYKKAVDARQLQDDGHIQQREYLLVRPVKRSNSLGSLLSSLSAGDLGKIHLRDCLQGLRSSLRLLPGHPLHQKMGEPTEKPAPRILP